MTCTCTNDTVTYFNGKRYLRRVRRIDVWTAGRKPRALITLAYRGVPHEWPAVISSTIR